MHDLGLDVLKRRAREAHDRSTSLDLAGPGNVGDTSDVVARCQIIILGGDGVGEGLAMDVVSALVAIQAEAPRGGLPGQRIACQGRVTYLADSSSQNGQNKAAKDVKGDHCHLGILSSGWKTSRQE